MSKKEFSKTEKSILDEAVRILKYNERHYVTSDCILLLDNFRYKRSWNDACLKHIVDHPDW